jgi:hypothetical protein
VTGNIFAIFGAAFTVIAVLRAHADPYDASVGLAMTIGAGLSCWFIAVLLWVL